MASKDISIKELVDMLVDKEIALPEMQRGYVWSVNKVVDLLYSLYQKYPTGSILTWKTSDHVGTRETAVHQGRGSEKELLLDGQQRLTSLAAVIKGKSLDLGNSSRAIKIMFNLDHPNLDDKDVLLDENGNSVDVEENAKDKETKLEEMVFAPHSRRIEGKSNWVSVTEALSADSVNLASERAESKNLDDPKLQKYLKSLTRLKGIEQYEYRVTTLSGRTHQEVTEIFVRINSKGTSLSSSDLALAYITAEWPSEKGKEGALPKINKYAAEASKRGYPLKPGILVRNLVVFATEQPKFNKVPMLSKKVLEEQWKKATEGLDYAINFMRGIGFYNLKRLSSPYFLIVVAFFAAAKKYRISTEEQENLRFWVLMANLKGRYSLSSESILARDIAAAGNPIELIRNLETHPGAGRLNIEANSMAGLNKSNIYFKILSLLLIKNCQDWITRLPIDPDSIGEPNGTQLHHIFPQSRLRAQGVETKKINDMANIAFISALANREISNKLPEAYLPDIDEKLLQAQLIPTSNKKLWEIENYDKFLAVRRELIAKGLNDFLDVEKFKKKLKKS